MGESKRKSTADEEETLNRRKLSVRRDGKGKLMKAKRRYRKAPNGSSSSGVRRTHSLLSKIDAIEMETKVEVDEELEQMKKMMSIHEAEMAAAKAVAEAEAAIAAADRAIEEADEAEGIAEELAKAFNSKSMQQKKQRWWQKI